jgi:4-diphosphocytidyl-2-C-methyl-D-erythritol kinase
MITVLAPAKLNLVLEVLGKRDDGYHEIRSLLQTISLCDIIAIEPASEISLECSDPALQSKDNLVIRAAELLRKACGYKDGAKIKLKKQIPWSAGLGGGSSDAAATLLALNDLWELRLKTPDLLQLAAELGSDVTFFIHKGTALIEGRGEKVTPLPPASSTSWFTLLLPNLPQLPDKTKQAYSRLKSQHFTKGQFTDIALESWLSKRKISPPLLFNTFDTVVFDIFPELKVYWTHLEQAGATNIHIAGSGPTIFAPVDSENMGRELCQRLTVQGFTSYVMSTNIESEGQLKSERS